MEGKKEYSVSKLMRYDMDKVSDEFYYRNEIQFPILADMDEAVILTAGRMKTWKREGNSIILQVDGDFYKKRYFYRFFDFRATYDLLRHKRNICVKLTVLSDDIIRVQAIQGFVLPERRSEMVVNYFENPIDFDVAEDDKALTISTKTVDVTITKEPWNITMREKTGRIFFTQHDTARHSEAGVMKFEQCPFGFLFDTKTDKTYASEQIEFLDDEHFYGFGEKFTKLDKKGQNINLWHTNALGCNTERTYKNVPFFISTRGYGLFMHTTDAINCNMGEHMYRAYQILTPDEAIDYFVIHGPSIKDILSRYTDITGKTPMPPRWSFGFWMSKISYKSRDEVENLASRLRAEDIPCDVIHLDTNWYEHDWICDYQFSEARFPDAPGMIKGLLDKGFRITLWQMPYIEMTEEHPNPVFEEGFAKGYFAVRKDGRNDFKHGLIDVSNPEAVEWYQQKLLRPLLEMGVAGIKVDFGESAPPFYRFAGGSGEKMHNLYPLLYNKAVFDITEAVHGKGESVIWARSTWAGSQRYPLHWAGDPDVDFAALAATIKAGLSFGLSGFPFWSHDIGGFNDVPQPDVYARWLQVGVFSSHSRTHGVVTREPWDFGPEALAIARKYLKLRYRLLPYIFAQSKKCVEMSLPMFRALIIEYQDDENVANIDNEYLFGDNFLVAPILDSTNERRVYLPRGIWTDYWTSEKLAGERWISVKAPLDILPLYVRENSIIPMGVDQSFVDEKSNSPITLMLYPAVNGQTTIALSDDTVITMTVTGKMVQLDISESDLEFTPQLVGDYTLLE